MREEKRWQWWSRDEEGSQGGFPGNKCCPFIIVFITSLIQYIHHGFLLNLSTRSTFWSSTHFLLSQFLLFFLFFLLYAYGDSKPLNWNTAPLTIGLRHFDRRTDRRTEVFLHLGYIAWDVMAGCPLDSSVNLGYTSDLLWTFPPILSEWSVTSVVLLTANPLPEPCFDKPSSVMSCTCWLS